MRSFPNTEVRREIGLIHDQAAAFDLQLLTLGYRNLGWLNSISHPSERHDILSGNSDWATIYANGRGYSLTVSITAKSFYTTDSSD